jgi:ParB-like chromosome segregation protein Spo0J
MENVMDASTRPNEPACPNVNAFIVSPAGDCALPARLRVQAERLRAVREQMEARDAEIEAAESRLRSKVGLGQLCDLRPCPENDEVYGAQSLNDPDILSLIASIKEYGVTDPIRISTDNVIISGHRRRFCAIKAGLTEVPVIREPISYKENRDEVLRLLVEANEQRKKSAGMQLREAAMRINPADAVQALRTEQKEKDAERLYGRMEDQAVEASGSAARKQISEGMMPFLDAALAVANANRGFWPVSVRQIHYRLLNDPPLKFTKKDRVKRNRKGEIVKVIPAVQDEARRYANDESSYKALVNLLARARVEGLFPWPAIDDETRPEDLNSHFWNPQAFFKSEFEDLLVGYRRNRQQSQPHHLEIVAEKLTVRSILDPIASEHSIPLTISRGHCGPTLKRKIADRFKRSKKEKLILLCVTDLDPAGEAIIQNFKDDLVDDHGLDDDCVEVYRCGLTMDRVEEFNLTPSYDTEEKDITTKQAYIDKYDTTDAWELESMEPSDLQDALTEDINECLDIDAYNTEVEQEDKDAVAIQARKAVVMECLRTLPDE